MGCLAGWFTLPRGVQKKREMAGITDLVLAEKKLFKLTSDKRRFNEIRRGEVNESCILGVASALYY